MCTASDLHLCTTMLPGARGMGEFVDRAATAYVELYHCHFKCGDAGLCLKGRTTAYLEGCRVEGSAGSGLELGDGAKAWLVRCYFRGNGRGTEDDITSKVSRALFQGVSGLSGFIRV